MDETTIVEFSGRDAVTDPLTDLLRKGARSYTDEKRYFVSESSAYRILKTADLITAPDYVVIQAAEEFKDKTTAINEMWQTDFTYFKIIGWGWYYLSTILDDYSCYIIAWKLCHHCPARYCAAMHDRGTCGLKT